MNFGEILKEEELELINGAVSSAQAGSSGKIRVRFCEKAGKDPLKKAKEAFVIMGLRDMPAKNAVLFYISIKDKKIAVLGDDGINEKVRPEFWENVKNAVVEKLKEGEIAIGPAGGINLVAEKFSEFFPEEKEEQQAPVNAVSFEEKE